VRPMNLRAVLVACALLASGCDDDDERVPAAPSNPEHPAPFRLSATTPRPGEPVSVSCTSDGRCQGLSWTVDVAERPPDAELLRAIFYDGAGRECAVGTSIYRRINGIDTFTGASFVVQCDLPFVTSRMGVQLLDGLGVAVRGDEFRLGWAFLSLPPRDPS
jgi:hypothetical protein